MKALVFNGSRDVRYETYRDPELTLDSGVILQVDQCSICGSDLHIYHGDQLGSVNYGDDVEKFCVGHEFIGEVVEVGASVQTFRSGDRVLAAGGSGCGRCPACLTGRSMSCPRLTAFGLGTSLQGGPAEYVLVPNADHTLHAIPDGVSDEQALLLTDAMATAYFGIQRADLQPGASLAVVGLGPIGLIGVELAFLLGASEVFAIDPVEERRKKAASLGAEVFAPGPEAKREILEASSGLGVDCVFEASGARAAVESVIDLARPGATASFIGLPRDGVALPLAPLLYRNMTVRAGVAPVPNLWPNLIPLLQSGRLEAAGIFTHEMSLAEGREAYELFDRRGDGVLKIRMHVRST